ncbi:hypothetical protein R6242_16130 [Iodobacter sp. CM08]|uniref:hypothetical protein n=1 Tax=Iodobacter sp. CM08 TaxID=3085902 RepID=UPI002982973E|nr:hypothetical protein [Iodobacter sp. CM08]MDW5418095.1 hypothetical protein [Iodobacter sp. CM08]
MHSNELTPRQKALFGIAPTVISKVPKTRQITFSMNTATDKKLADMARNKKESAKVSRALFSGITEPFNSKDVKAHFLNNNKPMNVFNAIKTAINNGALAEQKNPDEKKRVMKMYVITEESLG